MLVSVDIVEKDFFLRTTKNPSIEGLSELTDIKRYYKIVPVLLKAFTNNSGHSSAW